MPKGIYPHKKTSGFQKGHKIFEGSEKGQFKKGQESFKGMLGKKQSKEWKEKARERMKGNTYVKKGQHNSIKTEFSKGLIPHNKGKSNPLWQGKNNPRWKGGITPENEKIRHTKEVNSWRISVFIRDNRICQRCKSKEDIIAHHIRNFAEVIELRTSIYNGITFCRDCHKLFHKIYGYKNNNLEQVIKFINN